MKAAYLFNFSRFVSWPASSDSSLPDPFTICVMGKDPFGAVLDSTLAGETVGGKSVVVRRVAQLKVATSCQVLFIASSEDARLRDILGALDRASVLTVSDMPRFLDRGGMIEFVLQSGRVRFEVNLKPAADARLSMSSELLKVAVAVKKNGLREGAE